MSMSTHIMKFEQREPVKPGDMAVIISCGDTSDIGKEVFVSGWGPLSSPGWIHGEVIIEAHWLPPPPWGFWTMNRRQLLKISGYDDREVTETRRDKVDETP